MEGFSALIGLIILTTKHGDRGRMCARRAPAASLCSVHQQTNEDVRGWSKAKVGHKQQVVGQSKKIRNNYIELV